VSGQLHVPAALQLGENLSIHGVGGWVGPRSFLNGFGKNKNVLLLPGFKTRPSSL